MLVVQWNMMLENVVWLLTLNATGIAAYSDESVTALIFYSALHYTK